MNLNRFKPWFWIAAAYNALWGAFVVTYPSFFFEFAKMQPLNHPTIWQCVGMIVGVYAIGYAMIAYDPDRYGPFVYIGLLGKILGPLGFVFGASRGELPWAFGWVNVFNDLIWLPAFTLFAIAVWKNEKAKRSR